MDTFYKQIHMFTQFYTASQTSQVFCVVLHVFVYGFGVYFWSPTEEVKFR